MLSLDMAKKDDWADYRNSREAKKAYFKEAITQLHSRRNILQTKITKRPGDSETVGIRGLAISTASRTQWQPAEIEILMNWTYDLEKLGLIEILPTSHLPDTQDKKYYMAKLTDYSIEEAFTIINKI